MVRVKNVAGEVLLNRLDDAPVDRLKLPLKIVDGLR